MAEPAAGSTERGLRYYAPMASEFVTYLRSRPLVWGGILVVVFGLMGWLAWRTAQVPESPFTYQVM